MMTVAKWGIRLLSLLSLFFLCIFSTIAGTLEISTADPDWTYDNGSVQFPPGAQGEVTRGKTSLRLEGDFGRGGRYVSTVLSMQFPKAHELRFKIRTPASRVTVLLGTPDGKIRRVEKSLDGGAPEPREIVVSLGTRLKSIGVVLYQNDLRTDAGAMDISAIRLTGIPEDKMFTVCRADSPDSCFVVPGGSPFSLTVLVGRETFSPEELRYRCFDYTGKEVASGVAEFDTATRCISVPVPKSPGYYQLDFPALGVRSAMVAGAPYSGPSDDFFALDLPRDSAAYSGWMRLLRRIGVGWCRERLPWPTTESKSGDAGGHPDALQQAAATQGISVLDTLAGAAAPGNSPENLIETARNFAGVASRSESVKAVEVGRHPGIESTEGVPTQFMLALLRAISTRFARDKIPAAVVGGSGAFLPDDPDLNVYAMYLRGGLLEDVDALSFDSGEPVLEVEARIAAMREMEKKIRKSCAGAPYWVSGPEDEKAAALIARAVELRALGVAKYFQPTGDMIDANRAPRRTFGAYAHLPRALAFKEYVGDLKIEGATRSRTFSNGEEIVCCLYLEGTSKTLPLPEGLKILRVTGIDGRPLEIQNGQIPMDDGMVYLYPSSVGIMNVLEVDTPAMKVRDVARKFKPKTRSAKPVVIQPGNGPDSGIRNSIGNRVRCGDEFRIRTFFNNLSDQTITVSPYQNLPKGGHLIREQGVAVTKSQRSSFEILPGDRMEYEFSIQTDPSLSPQYYSMVSVAERNGKATTMLIPIKPYERARLLLPLNGKPSDWIDFSCPFNWHSESKLSEDILAKFRVSAREKGLRFEVEVRERTHGPGDAVRLAFQLRKNPEQVSGGVFQYRVSCFESRVKEERLLPSGRSGPAVGVRAEFWRLAGGISRYVIDVPATAFGITSLKKGMFLGLFLAVDSGDGEGVRGTLSWGEGIGTKTIPELFQLIEF